MAKENTYDGDNTYPVALYNDRELADKHADLAQEYIDEMTRYLNGLSVEMEDERYPLTSPFDSYFEYYPVSNNDRVDIEYYTIEETLYKKEDLAMMRATSWRKSYKLDPKSASTSHLLPS